VLVLTEYPSPTHPVPSLIVTRHSPRHTFLFLLTYPPLTAVMASALFLIVASGASAPLTGPGLGAALLIQPSLPQARHAQYSPFSFTGREACYPVDFLLALILSCTFPHRAHLGMVIPKPMYTYPLECSFPTCLHHPPPPPKPISVGSPLNRAFLIGKGLPSTKVRPFK